jgi:hypothetical protein
MALPTKNQWNALKSNAGIAKSAWWKPADAAVGPALGKLESAKADWKAKKNLDSARSYMGALAKVHEAFQKFLAKKDLSAAGPLKNQINGWIQEVENKHEQLRAKIPSLKEENTKELEGILESSF